MTLLSMQQPQDITHALKLWFYFLWLHPEPTLGLLPQSSSVPACIDSVSANLQGQGWLPYCQQSWRVLSASTFWGWGGENIRKTKLNCKREKDVFLLENRFFWLQIFFYKLWLLFLWSSRVEFEINWGRRDTIFFNFFILRPSRTSHCRPYMIHRKRFSIRNLSIQSGKIRSSGSVWQAGDPKDVICISSNII